MQPQTGAKEVRVSNAGVGEGGGTCLDVGDVLRCSGTGRTSLWVGDLGYSPTHWDYTGRLPPQGGPQNDKSETENETE